MKKNNYVDCNKLIDKKAKRCSKCRYKFVKGKNNPNYRTGNYIKHFCIDCGKKVTTDSKRCLSCGQLNRFKRTEERIRLSNFAINRKAFF